ncbi:MAG: PilN domain-containing protein [Elusimicrobia bacterium]|nr:PilN domain-containing protein [Elusimicrobiota bacterium]
MIKINLLPREMQRKEGAKKQIQVALLSIILVLCLLLVWYISLYTSLIKKQKDLKTAETDLEKVSVLVAAVEQKKQQKEILERKWGIVEKLLQGRFKWTMIMDELQKCLPKSIWLTSLQGTKTDAGNLITINGMAFDHFSIADFVTNTEDNDYFDNVELISITEASGGDRNTRTTLNFNITMTSKL